MNNNLIQELKQNDLAMKTICMKTEFKAFKMSEPHLTKRMTDGLFKL